MLINCFDVNTTSISNEEVSVSDTPLLSQHALWLAMTSPMDFSSQHAQGLLTHSSAALISQHVLW